MRRELSPETPFPAGSGRTNAPDYREGFLRIPLSVWYGVFSQAGGPHPLTRRQLQIVAVVIRETWGWSLPSGGVRLWTRQMTPGQFARSTGLSTDRLARDLRALLDRGVLLEKEGKYQFVPYPQAWLPPAAKRRSAPPKCPNEAAETSLPQGRHRQRKESLKKRLPQAPLKGGDNSDSEMDGYAEPPVGPSLKGRESVEKVYRLVTSIVGSLDPGEAERLQRWVEREGIAGVWREMEPLLRWRCEAARAAIKDRLRTNNDRSEPAPPEGTDQPAPPEESEWASWPSRKVGGDGSGAE